MMIIEQLIISLVLFIHPFFLQTPSLEYLTQPGTPVMTQNFISPEDGCNWGGVAGQVFGLDGLPVNGKIVEVRGELDGDDILLATTSGSSQQVGPGGFDIQFSDSPIETAGDLYLVLLNAEGETLSRRVFFATGGTCNQNLTIINLTAFNVVSEYYFPMILNQH